MSHVRNFWIDGTVDGRATGVEGGPRSKDGGFSMTVYIRDEGGIETGVRMSGRVGRDGELVLNVSPGTTGEVTAHDGGGFTMVTKR